MASRKLGIYLIAAGLILFALQLDGIYRALAFVALGLLGAATWWQAHRVQGLLAVSLAAISLGLATLLALATPLKTGLLAGALFITWLAQGKKLKQHWTLLLAMVFAAMALASWQGISVVIALEGNWAPLLIGLAFAIAYAFTSKLGLLIPAAILLALGLVTMLPGRFFADWQVFASLGAAFFAIWLVHTRRLGTTGSKIWPLFPAGVLLLFALVIAVTQHIEGLFLPLLLGIPALVLLSVYPFRRHLGLLIPALMLAAVAVWFLLGAEHVSLLLFALATAFALVALLHTRHKGSGLERWWPLIPAGVLTFNGAMLLSEGWDSARGDINFLIFGLVLIGVGLLIIFSHHNKNS